MHTISGRSTRASGGGLSVWRLDRLALAILGTILVWHDRTRERYWLALQDDRMLRDIGLTRADVERECGKPFWRP